MLKVILSLSAVIFVGLHPSLAFSCLWDSDTIAVESKRFPEAIAIISGNFPRHSKAYYQWRVDHILKMPKGKWSATNFNDLAVAYEKLEQSDKAIATMEDKKKKFGDDYETFANLGTFLVHAGRYQEGLKNIDRAIKINPKAHFGREIYQRFLVKYLIETKSLRGGKPKLPVGRGMTFPEYLEKELNDGLPLSLLQTQDSIKGVLGMMRFMDHKNPVLLQVLAELLASAGADIDAKNLAVMAYLKASEVSAGSLKKSYRETAERNIGGVKRKGQKRALVLADFLMQLKWESKNGDQLFAKISGKEAEWIASGVDVDENFKKTFLNE